MTSDFFCCLSHMDSLIVSALYWGYYTKGPGKGLDQKAWSYASDISWRWDYFDLFWIVSICFNMFATGSFIRHFWLGFTVDFLLRITLTLTLTHTHASVLALLTDSPCWEQALRQIDGWTDRLCGQVNGIFMYIHTTKRCKKIRHLDQAAVGRRQQLVDLRIY